MVFEYPDQALQTLGFYRHWHEGRTRPILAHTINWLRLPSQAVPAAWLKHMRTTFMPATETQIYNECRSAIDPNWFRDWLL